MIGSKGTQTEQLNDQRTSQPITTDVATGLTKRNAEKTQTSEPRVPVEPAIVKTGPVPLLPTKETEDLHSRWIEVQGGFVDEPRKSVEQADALVAGVMKRLAESFASERSKLEGQWSRGDNVSTEELRLALQHYRSFFDRLLSL